MKKIVGYIDVDAGIVQVGDPCYTLAKPEREGVDYTEMIDRLVDHDDIRLKLSHEELERIRAHTPHNRYHPYLWDKPVLTDLSPEPEDQDGVVHKWQPVYNPYKDGKDMKGSPHNGAGLAISSGWGDGSYPVEIEWDDEGEYWEGTPDRTFELNGETYVAEKGRPPSVHHRVKSVKITFISDDEEENDVDVEG